MPTFTVIYDNAKDNETLQEGFGFSCLIEFGNTKILFDTGGSRTRFFANINKLGIDLKSVTHIVFSHKHFDHIAGFEEILNIVSNAQVYLPSDFPDSLVQQVPSNIDAKRINSFTEITKDVYSLPLLGKHLSISIHEQSLVFNTQKGLIILTGCGHPGIVHIVKMAQERFPTQKVLLVMGGFHLYQSWRFTSARVVRQIKELGVEKVAPCHCSGKMASKQFQKRYGENFIKVGTGTILEL